jgi:hypothetical protein
MTIDKIDFNDLIGEIAAFKENKDPDQHLYLIITTLTNEEMAEIYLVIESKEIAKAKNET